MSTSTLVIIAVLICVICVICLWAVQLKRQRAIERARKTIIYNAQINQLQQIAETTAPYLDDSLIKFIASRIIYNGQLLINNKIIPDKRCHHTIDLAQGWLTEPKSLRKQARKGKKESQQKILTLLKSIIQHIRQGVMEHQVNRSEAKQLAHAAKFSKIKLSCQYNQLSAEEALKAGELQQGIALLKKIKILLKRVSPLPNDLQQQLIECEGLIDKTQQSLNEQNENSSSKRLEEEFDKQEEQDQDWQKKQLYDQ
ncbi:MAG: hypothetical protein V7765_17005 [Oleispira sp.]